MQKQTARDIGRSLLMGVGIGVLMALIFGAGFFARDVIHLPASVAAASGDGYPLLDEVQGLIDRHFLRDQPTATQREYAAIRGMLSSLNDRFTFFIDPPVAASESDALAGTYGGIGVQIKRNEKGGIELYPYNDSPASKAGIADGDVLLAINGTALDSSTAQDAIDQMMRGEVKEGSGVQLTVAHVAGGDNLTVFVPFAVINVPSVTWHMLAEDSSIGYVQVSLFTGRTPDELKTALQDLNSKHVQALVLDLRNNAGGLLQESVEVANAFIGSGPLAFEDAKDGEQAFNAQADALITSLPLTVLVNDHTASGAELVAGALQDDQRGILIGQKTYGKGTVQQIYPLSDGSSLHITAAAWLTPKKHALDQAGLQPDIALVPDAEGRDVELGEAVRYLQQKLGSDEATPEATVTMEAAS
ncbi:MAG: S41 family peptidase [Chloroflexota bacterium]